MLTILLAALLASPEIEELGIAYRILASSEAGVLEVSGGVSIRSRSNPKHFYVANTASGVVEKDVDGAHSGELRVYGAIYKARPDVNVIVHSHAPELVAFASSSVPLRRRDEVVPVADAVEALGAGKVLLLRNHGAVVAGSALRETVLDAIGLRKSAQLEQQLIAMGGTWDLNPLRPAANAAAARTAEGAVPSREGGGRGPIERLWDYYQRMALEPQKGGEKPAPQSVIDDLVTANRILSARVLGIMDGLGHLSVRNPRNPNHYFIARYVSAAFVTAADIIENDLDSKPVGGPRDDEFQEVFIHGEIYKARPDAMAILHAHTPEIVAFTMSSVALRPIAFEGAFIGEGLPDFDIRKFDPREILVRTPPLGRDLAVTLGARPAVLMKGHGYALIDASLPALVEKAYGLRLNARIQQQAIALRGDVVILDTRRSVPAAEGRGWEHWKHLAEAK
jgi:ribulose-5-phosphate 4-epimerase/fuculose-1-phosphate aldolase